MWKSGGVPAGHYEQPGAGHTETYPLKQKHIISGNSVPSGKDSSVFAY